jgi:transposase
MLDMLKRHEIKVLRKAGHTQVEAANLAEVSERSVRRVEAEPAITSVDDAEEIKRRRIGRPSKAEPFRKLITEILKKEPELLSLELLRRARLEGYKGGKTALYALIAAVRPKKQRPMVRFEGLPGEFSQHDFGQVDVHFIDGSKKRIHFFASRLKYSRWVEVTLVPNQRVEALVRTMTRHFEAFGGIPLLAVFDRPKTIAKKWKKDGTVTEWNTTFANVALDLGLGVELAWPRRGNQKGSVENLVGWVKGSFFKQRRFLDLEDLEKQLAEWHEEVNTQRPCRATAEIPAERMAEEKKRLRPLKVAPPDLALRYPIYVGPTGLVLFETNSYSMPPGAIGLPGTLYLYTDRVRIIAGRFRSDHERLVGPHAKSMLAEHRAAMLAEVSGKRGRRYLKREHLLEVGSSAMEYLTEITHRRPNQWIREVDQLHALLQTHGEYAMDNAFKKALSARTFGAEYVQHYLLKAQEGRENGPLNGSSERPPAPQHFHKELPI